MSILGEGEIGEIGQIDSAVISHPETGPGRNRRGGSEETNIYMKLWMQRELLCVTCYIFCTYLLLHVYLDSALSVIGISTCMCEYIQILYCINERHLQHVTRPDLARRTACPKEKERPTLTAFSHAEHLNQYGCGARRELALLWS